MHFKTFHFSFQTAQQRLRAMLLQTLNLNSNGSTMAPTRVNGTSTIQNVAAKSSGED